MYKIAFSKSVRKFLVKHKDVAKLFYRILKELTEDPIRCRLDISPVKGKKWHYRLRIWKYRFLYEVRNKEVLIYFYEADSRGDIYKRL